MTEEDVYKTTSMKIIVTLLAAGVRVTEVPRRQGNFLEYSFDGSKAREIVRKINYGDLPIQARDFWTAHDQFKNDVRTLIEQAP